MRERGDSGTWATDGDGGRGFPATTRAVSILLAIGVTIPGATAANAQELILAPVVELGSAEASIVPSTSQSVIRAGDGRFLVSHLLSGGPGFAVYGAGGELVALYQERGDGPGELRGSPRLYPGPGHQIWASDGGRLIRLDGRLHHVATTSLEHPLVASRTVHLDDGVVVTNSRIPAPDGGFFTVTVRDSTGAVMEGLEPQADPLASTILAPAANGGFFTLQTNQRLLRRYSEHREISASVRMTIDHFEPWEGEASELGREGFDFPPRPRHVGLFHMGDDLIVVLTRVTDDEWVAHPSGQMFTPSEVDYNGQYDTMISLMDLRTGETLVTRRVPEYLRVVDGTADLAYAVHRGPYGHVTTRIMRLEARRP